MVSFRLSFVGAPSRYLSFLVLAVAVGSCGTQPVSPEGCKDIENARCRAASSCSVFGSNFDVAGCERFYRDQCLRGLRTAVDPGDPKIQICVKAIERAGVCAREDISPCDVGSREILNPCALVETPEQFSECGFLDDGFQEDSGDMSDSGLSPFFCEDP